MKPGVNYFLFLAIVFAGLFATGCKKQTSKQHRKKIKKEVLEPVHLASGDDKNSDPPELMLPLIDEKEPNDYPSWAQVLPIGVGARGFVNRPWKEPTGIRPDWDVFLFEVTGKKKKILWAKIAPPTNVDLFLAVYKPNLDRIVVQDSNGPGKDEIIVNLTLKPGKYFFKIGQKWRKDNLQYNLKVPYVFQWKLKEPSEGEEIEPNNRRVNANTIIMGRIVRGYLSSKKDYDFFLIPTGSAHFRIDFSPPKRIGAYLAIWPVTGKKSTWKMKIKEGKPLVFRRMKFRKNNKFVVLYPSNEQYSLTSKYMIKFSIETEDGHQESEPNDTVESANLLSGTSGMIKGYITVPTDKDIYSLKIETDVISDISLSPALGEDLKICIQNKVDMCRVSKNGKDATFNHIFFKKGNYKIVISSKEGYDSENRYILSWKSSSVQPGDEKEPNNSKRRANIILSSQPVKGFLSTFKDKDVFKFRFKGRLSDPPRIHIQLSGGENINPVLILMDSYGNIVKSDTSGVYSGVRNIRTPVHPYKNYYIIVKDKTGNQKNSKKPYELRLEKETIK